MMKKRPEGVRESLRLTTNVGVDVVGGVRICVAREHVREPFLDSGRSVGGVGRACDCWANDDWIEAWRSMVRLPAEREASLSLTPAGTSVLNVRIVRVTERVHIFEFEK